MWLRFLRSLLPGLLKVNLFLGLLKGVRKIRFEGSNPIRLSKLNFEKKIFRKFIEKFDRKVRFIENKKFIEDYI